MCILIKIGRFELFSIERLGTEHPGGQKVLRFDRQRFKADKVDRSHAKAVPSSRFKRPADTPVDAIL